MHWVRVRSSSKGFQRWRTVSRGILRGQMRSKREIGYRRKRRVHSPPRLQTKEVLRRDCRPVDVHTWFRWFLEEPDKGIIGFLPDAIALAPEEPAAEHPTWQQLIACGGPHFRHGFPEVLVAYRARGGRVAVVSHFESHVILGHYQDTGGGPAGAWPPFRFGLRRSSVGADFLPVRNSTSLTRSRGMCWSQTISSRARETGPTRWRVR